MKKKEPEIRFKGFDEKWEELIAESVFRVYYDKNHPDLPVLSATQEYGMVVRDSEGFVVQHNKENEIGYKRVLPGQFVIHLRSFQGGFAHSLVEGITSPAYTIIEFQDKKRHDDIFWKYTLSSKSFIKRLETVTYGIRDGRSISFNDFSELSFVVPNFEEQKKMGKIFVVIDTLIRKLELKLEKLRNIKQALLNQMFVNSNRGGYEPLIRFKGYEGEWNVIKLIDISDKVINKNIHRQYSEVFTNSAEYGIINQKEYFDRNIVNSENIQGYYLVFPDDFVYNPRISTTAPVGPINRNENKYIGVVSPLYYVFRIKNDSVDLSYLDFFFKNSSWHSFMIQNGNSGARSDRFSISDATFVKLPIQHPSNIKEQKKIGGYFLLLDKMINNSDEKLRKVRNMKQSLLQKMFA